MQDSGMRDARLGGDFLQANCFRSAVEQPPLGSIEDGTSGLNRASTALSLTSIASTASLSGVF